MDASFPQPSKGATAHMAPLVSARFSLSICPGDPPVPQGKGYDLLCSLKRCDPERSPGQ